MLLTCPVCHNFVRVSTTPELAVSQTGADMMLAGKNRFECRTCAYQLPLVNGRRFSQRTPITPKEADDVMGGAQRWAGADTTESKCPNEKCDNDRAYFYQVQIRSADEPMTSFFRCTKCGKRWKE